MSLFYLYRCKFAVKLQIIMFENAIIGHFATRAVSEQFWPCCWEIHQAFYFFACASYAPPPNHLVPVFSCEKPLNIKTSNKNKRPRSRLALSELGWKTLKERRLITKARLMYKITHSQASVALTKIFENSQQIYAMRAVINLRGVSTNKTINLCMIT